jgi:APA family basic amino acid/polyamine antiporter
MTRGSTRSKLTLFDVTNLVVGGAIGADIYIAGAFGAQYLGPFSLMVWVIGGVMAITIALAFAQCAALTKEAGGPYAYAKEAWGPFAGFLVGWSLWLAEWVSLAVFPIAFVQYLMFFLPNLDPAYQIIVKILFVTFLATTNIVGARAAGKTNDLLTLVKLGPLILFIGFGLVYMVLHPVNTISNFTPFIPSGFSGFGVTLVLVFWAYAGFELSTIPANEIEDPERTIPKAMVLGMTIVTIFYLLTNLVLFGVLSWTKLAGEPAPLASAATVAFGLTALLALLGGAILGAGALVCVSGSDESGMIGTAGLGYALAAEGLFPRALARTQRRFKTPYVAILVQSITALVASIFGSLGLLVATSVFLLGVPYFATSLSVLFLRKKNVKSGHRIKGGKVVPVLGAFFSIFLISQCTVTQILLGLALIVIGIPIYARYAPKKELKEIKSELFSRKTIMEKVDREEQKFLAHPLSHVKKLYRRSTQKEKRAR